MENGNMLIKKIHYNLIEDKNYHLDKFYEKNKALQYKFQDRFNKFKTR